MNLEQFKATVPRPLRVVTIVLLRRGGEVVLGMKKQGFGVGKWNGFGGKTKEGESVWKCAYRETEEESTVRLNTMRRVAYLNFYFRDIPITEGWNQQAQVILCDNWSGVPQETDEMRPETFRIDDLPLDDMWPFDRLWMPRLLADERLVGEFLFGGEGEPVEHRFLPYSE